MDAFQLNKIAGAVLGSLTVVLGVNAIAGALFKDKEPEKPGFEVAVKAPEGGAPAAGGGEGAGVLALLAKADAAKGESAAKKCGACHSFDKGGAAKAGPNLYGVIGLKHAHQDGFGYSAAMKATADKTWDFEAMDKWLESPKGYISGTSMAFAGIKNPEERANLIVYLNKNSDKPLDIPAAPAGGAAAPAAGAAPAGGGDDFKAQVAAADLKKGESASKKCGACHSFDKGGAAKAGPNLYGILGLKHAHQDGFGYSAAMKATADKTWDVDAMNKWLESPKGYISGTSMAFAGIKNPQERAALIAWLNQNSDKPLDLGAAAPAAAPAEEKKTEAAPAAPAPAAPAEEKKTEAAPAAPAPAAPAEEKKADAPAEQPAAPAAASGAPIAERLASADLAAGEKTIGEKCAVCHTVKKGEPAGAGPNLYGVVGLKHGHQEGFEYSDALKGKPGDWTFDQLDLWLQNADAYAPGTMMFMEIEDPQERANIIAWLNKNSDAPLPLPGK
ncbi:c-type cytochrome [Methylopila musalis]|uniref:C-type cytochrome n=1 Tax=Methylopila musalis TaxID=1134781 RepID=A0ABW3Z6D7_9HYPH